jgi:hypothetical protein
MFCLDNLSTHTIEEKDPSAIDPDTDFNYPATGFKDVNEYRTWTKLSNTKYCIFSMIEGEIKNQRVTSTNEPVKIHGIVADYDPAGGFDNQEIQDFVRRSLNADHPCAYLSKSFSGGLHVIWFFEEPVSVYGMKAAKAFLTRASKELGLSKLARGLDKTVAQPERYYRYGKDWKVVANHVIPRDTVWSWAMGSVKQDTFASYGAKLPLAAVQEEVEKRWPGAWQGPFEEGSRGPTFFDPHGGHASTDSAIIRENGVQVFNMEKGFYSWSEILGHKFVKQFLQKQLGHVIANYYYDGKSYWEKSDTGFMQLDKQDMAMRLRTKHSLSSKVPKGSFCSEIDEVMVAVMDNKCVDAAVPFIYNPKTVVDFNGGKFLNLSKVKVFPPDKNPQQWAVNFPFIASLLEGVYRKKQLPYLLAWASRFYKGAYGGKPAPGHAIFTIGAPGSGKTFINTGIFSPLFGGQAPCGSFLMGETKYTSSLFEKGLWTVDDNDPASTSAKYRRYTSIVKALVANAVFEVEEKFRKAGRICWLGRLCVTANLTEEDIRMIPELDTHTRDKVMVFKGHSHTVKFGTFEENEETVLKELPFFARWLLDHQPDPKIVGSHRFGVKEFIHPEVEEFLLNNSRHAYLLEVIEFFKSQYFTDESGPTEWKGTSAKFLQLVSNWTELNKALEGRRDQDIGFSLGYFHRKGVPWLSKNSRNWIIKNV